MTEYPMLIGGAPITTSTPRPIRIPFDGSPAATVFEAGPRETNAALEAALCAAPVMRALTRHERSSINTERFKKSRGGHTWILS